MGRNECFQLDTGFFASQPRQDLQFMKKIGPLHVFIRDDDSKVYGIAGPIAPASVNEWLDVEASQRASGRKVSVFEVSEDLLRLHIEAANGHGLSQIEPEQIIPLPKDRSMEYTGLLPAYAAGADRDRIVKILCKAKCRRETLAEMDQPYPGQAILKKSEVGDFVAKCLKCGGVAKDPYNWRR